MLEEQLGGSLVRVLAAEPGRQRLRVLAARARTERAAQSQRARVGVFVLADRSGELGALAIAAPH